MQFGRHGTFYIRDGWISKGLGEMKDEGTLIFSPINMGEAIDTLGMGKVMVSSLRYWLNVTGLACEGTENGQIKLKPTNLGKIIYKHDRFLERKGTLWILHYKLATADNLATTWYWFFNKFSLREFSERNFIEELDGYIKMNSEREVSESTLKKDFRCLKGTYLYEPNQDIEDAISSPFRELKLLSKVKGRSLYSKNKPNINEIAPQIFYYLILESLEDDEQFGDEKERMQISIDELVYKEKSVGKALNLPLNDIYDLLHELDNLRYIKLHQKFGSNFVTTIKSDKWEILKNYYGDYNID